MIREIVNLFQTGDTVYALIILFAELFSVFCILPVHECAHAWAAVKLGDETPRYAGRLTLSPMAHLDLFGVLLLLVTGFGYAKPVQVNIRNFKNRKRDFALTAVAGPLSNLAMALLFFLLSNLLDLFGAYVCAVMSAFCYYVGWINVNLAVFNLLPIPPLDGSRVASVLVPDKYYYLILKNERYIMIGLMLLMFSGVLSTPLSFLTEHCADGLNFIASLPFRLFR